MLIILDHNRERALETWGLFVAVRLAGWLLLAVLLNGCMGTVPHVASPLDPVQNLGHDWRKHYLFGLELMEKDHLAHHKTVFSRAAFASAARFSRDYAPAYVGLGLAEMNFGNFSEAQVAFLNAALIENRSLYWALSALAALNNGDERVARTLFDAMQAAPIQDADPASRFVRAVYLPQDKTYAIPLSVITHNSSNTDVDADTVCQEGSEERVCRNLNVVANVYFVRRYSSDVMVRGTSFFNDLAFQLGAESSFEWQRGEPHSALHQVTLSIPEIQYAVRLAPFNSRSSIYLNAAPSVMTSIGETSEIREGSDLTILYNSSGYADDFTAETGMLLRIRPELATPEFVKLQLEFEFSSVATFVPSAAAQVLDVSTNTYAVSGHFPYGRPVVLGTISGGTQSHNGAGQKALRRLPLIGGGFGESRDEVSSSDTLVLGVLSEPSAFRGSHEQTLLAAMAALGVATPTYSEIRRRKIIYQAPDVMDFLPDFLRQLAPAAP